MIFLKWKTPWHGRFFIFSNGSGGLVMRLNQVLITMPLLDKG